MFKKSKIHLFLLVLSMVIFSNCNETASDAEETFIDHEICGLWSLDESSGKYIDDKYGSDWEAIFSDQCLQILYKNDGTWTSTFLGKDHDNGTWSVSANEVIVTGNLHDVKTSTYKFELIDQTLIFTGEVFDGDNLKCIIVQKRTRIGH